MERDGGREFLDLGRHHGRLGEVGKGPHALGLGAVLAGGEKMLFELASGSGQHGVGEIEDRLGGAVVAFELDELGARKQAREIQDVVHRRAAKGVD